MFGRYVKVPFLPTVALLSLWRSVDIMLTFLTALVLPCLATALSVATSPTAEVKNGTVVGKHVREWEQEHFLGIPFAQPPVGQLRFARPKSIEKKFDGPLDATQYGYSCYQYSNPTFNLSEDCLTLNGHCTIS